MVHGSGNFFRHPKFEGKRVVAGLQRAVRPPKRDAEIHDVATDILIFCDLLRFGISVGILVTFGFFGSGPLHLPFQEGEGEARVRSI